MTKRYHVHTPINHDGEQYHPDLENNFIELSDKNAKPLLDVGAISEADTQELTPEPDAKQQATTASTLDQTSETDTSNDQEQSTTSGDGEQTPEDITSEQTSAADTSNVVQLHSRPEDKAARLLVIKKTIDGLDKDDETKWTKNSKPDATVLTELLGWAVSAAERDAAFELSPIG